MDISPKPLPGNHGRGRVLREILEERERQIEDEGFTLAHDNHHRPGELARAAACYAMPKEHRGDAVTLAWPWGHHWWKPGDRRRELTKAAALIVAELEMIYRTDGSAK